MNNLAEVRVMGEIGMRIIPFQLGGIGVSSGRGHKRNMLENWEVMIRTLKLLHYIAKEVGCLSWGGF